MNSDYAPVSMGQDNSVVSNMDFNPALFAEVEVAQIVAVCDTVCKSVTTVAETVKYIADVKLEISKLDHQLDAFIAQTNANLERFKTMAPLLDRQLTNISHRIDKITDNIIEQTKTADLSKDGMEKHKMLIDLLSTASDSFNNMLIRMLAL